MYEYMAHACFFHKKDTGIVNIWNKLWWWCIMVWNNFWKRTIIFINCICVSLRYVFPSVFTGVSILLLNEADTNFLWRYRCFKNRHASSKIIFSHCEIYCQHLLKPHSMCNVCDICTASLFLFLDMYNTKETIRTDVRLFVSYDS